MSLYQIRDPRPDEVFNFFHESNFRKRPAKNGYESVPRSRMEFLENHPQINTQHLDFLLDTYVARRLLSIKRRHGSDTWYESRVKVSENDINYGKWDLELGGFTAIRNTFARAVLPVVVVKPDGDPDIGTAFLIDGNCVVTAKHCIEAMAEIRIGDWPNRKAELEAIFVSNDAALDAAILQFNKLPFDSTSNFQFSEGNVLDPVLAMGYPPIPGFQPIQISETANVAAIQKATIGQKVADAIPYFPSDNVSRILVSARIKGGNSGGPIINKFGKVIGVAEMLPADEQGRADQLGFAVAICSSELQRLMAQIKSKEAIEMKFEDNGEFIKTLGV